MNELTKQDSAVMEAVVSAGDLSKLSPAQRVQWYVMRCEAAGLDPRTQPFQYITLQGKLTLYATKTATEQLCAVRGISTQIVSREKADDLYIVTCRAMLAGGRMTESIGAVSIAGARGDALANALMKAETKAKRRAVLALCGLGMLDETETETIPGAQFVEMPLVEVQEKAAQLPPATTTPPDAPTETAKRAAVTKCAIKTGKWKNVADHLPAYYAHPQHALNTLAGAGYSEVTDANINEVSQFLLDYAVKEADKDDAAQAAA